MATIDSRELRRLHNRLEDVHTCNRQFIDEHPPDQAGTTAASSVAVTEPRHQQSSRSSEIAIFNRGVPAGRRPSARDKAGFSSAAAGLCVAVTVERFSHFDRRRQRSALHICADGGATRSLLEPQHSAEPRLATSRIFLLTAAAQDHQRVAQHVDSHSLCGDSGEKERCAKESPSTALDYAEFARVRTAFSRHERTGAEHTVGQRTVATPRV